MAKHIKFNGKIPLECALDLRGITPSESMGEPEESKQSYMDRKNCTTHYLMTQEPSFLEGLLGVFDNYIWYAKKIHNTDLLKNFKQTSKFIKNRKHMYEKNYKSNYKSLNSKDNK